jgi:hypothetical protein
MVMIRSAHAACSCHETSLNQALFVFRNKYKLFLQPPIRRFTIRPTLFPHVLAVLFQTSGFSQP